ncbi:hypothetical protein O7628_05940 [Micromonospora sp. WMMD956]|uniref:hypothetical protein n=1 Tax=Micromonospora sp. WMMD956 TaxID=3016108 RepID=UPI00241663DA|nr:hypothetical protein [Micromonospora sp. WMMD956]MDG4815046.1 hypothetical protein [Micromonospora sp. WMMD956]
MRKFKGGRGRSVDLVAEARADAERRHAHPQADAGPRADAGPPARRGAAPTAARPAPTGALIGVLLVLGLVAFPIVSVVIGPASRERIEGYACAVTGCTGPGMATAGWLLITVPFLSVVTAVAFWSRLPGRARTAVAVVAAPLVLGAYLFIPSRRRDLDDLLDGPARYATATGITWAWAGLALALLGLLVVAVLADIRKTTPAESKKTMPTGRGKAALPPVWAPLVAAGACLAMLGVALGRADPVPVTAELAFPERTFTVAGDTLTRTSADDQRGCAGVLDDDERLAGCVRTVRGSWTTDDSDAVVRLAAVLFPTEDAARERRGPLRSGTAQAGLDGDTADVVSTSKNWVLFVSVGHADGRAIDRADRGHLMWAASQVVYRFIGHQVGLLVAPTPKDGIGPRTP